MTERIYVIKGYKRYWAPASPRYRAGWTSMRDLAISADIAVYTDREEAKKVRNILRKKYCRTGQCGKFIRVMDFTNDPKLPALTSAKLKYNVRP